MIFTSVTPRRWGFYFHLSLVVAIVSIFVLQAPIAASAAAAKSTAADSDSDLIVSATTPSEKTSVTTPASGSSSSPPAKSRKTRQQNFYNYRTNYDDDRTYAYFEGDTAGNYVSDFGLRTNRPSARVSNPFEIFGPGRSSSSVSANGSDGRSRSRYDDIDEDYLLMDNGGEGVIDDGVGGVADDYDDYQDPQQQQQYLDDPPAEGRRYDGARRTRIRIRPTSIANGAGWSGNTHLSTSRGPNDASYSFGYTAGAGTGFVVNQNRLAGGGYHRIRPAIPSSPPRVKVTVGGSGGGGWSGVGAAEEEEDIYQSQGHRIPQRQGGWQPPRRRKPSYVVKIRRPVKPEPPAWIYYRPPNPGRPAPGGWRRRRPQTTARPTKVYPDEDLGTGGGGGWSQSDLSESPYPKDASYHFAYDAGDHDRNEYSDPWGNVRGSYSYIDPSGIRRTVHYSAGSVSGFKILSASPSQIVQRVYQGLPGPISKIRPKPSAFVYHLHPDSGWKPWEASETNIIGQQQQRPRTRPLKNGPVATSYQYQSFGKSADDISSEDSNFNVNSESPGNDNTRKHALASASANEDGQGQEKVMRHRGSGRAGSRHRMPQQQQQYHRQIQKDDAEPIYEQENVYGDEQLTDDEYQIVADTKYEPLKTNNENGKIMIQSYKGGYGDKNPLLVMSESSTRARESSSSMKEGKQGSRSSNSGGMASASGSGGDEYESTTSRPISVARMMSMRMSKSRKMMKMMKNKSSMAMVKSINEASNNMRRRNSKSNQQSDSENSGSSSSSSRTMNMHMKNMNNVRMNLDSHHSPSSVSQSQSYPHDDEDEGQARPLPLSRQMSIMTADRRLAHYPKSNQHTSNGIDDEMMHNYHNGRMMLLVPMPMSAARENTRPPMHYPLLY